MMKQANEERGKRLLPKIYMVLCQYLAIYILLLEEMAKCAAPSPLYGVKKKYI